MVLAGERHTLDGVHGVGGGGGRGGREDSSRLTPLEHRRMSGPVDPLTGNMTVRHLGQGLRGVLGGVAERGEAVGGSRVLGQRCLQLRRLVWVCPGVGEGGGLGQNIKVQHDLIVQARLEVLLRV